MGVDEAIVVGVHLTDDAAALRRSLPTVVHQRLDVPLHVCVIDDAASDEARAALAQLASWYPDVEIVRNEVRRGRAAARNQVLDRAGDASVAWLDLGDVWHPRKLAVQHALLRATADADAVLVACTHRQVDLTDATERIVVPDLGGDLRLRVLDRDLEVPVGTVLGRADAFRLVGAFDPAMPYRDDEELLLRFLEGGGRFEVPRGGPYSTGTVVRDHPSARDVTMAERRFRRLHGARMRALDPSGARRAHRRELQRAARLHGKDDRRVHATGYRVRADLTAAVDRATRGVSRRRAVPPRRSTAPRAGAAGAAPAPAPAALREVEVPEALGPVHAAAEADAWADALAAWASLPDDVRTGADPISYELVARSHRALGQHHEAIAVAEAGLARWPDHPRVELELAKSRAAVTDWAIVLRPTADGAPDADGPGTVTSLGPLRGEDGLVRGHVRPTAAPLPPRVTLEVDGTEVVTTEADSDGRFSLSCGQLLEFLGDGDVLRVVAEGRPLPLPGLGLSAEVRTGYPSRLPALRARLAGGAVFTKFGQLRPGYTPARKSRTLELADEVAGLVAEVTGRTCTPFYGNLLGAIREQDFIAHDVGGFDVGYLSSHRDPAAVRGELLTICRRLLDRGFHLELEPFGALIRRTASDRIFVDLNVAWATPDGELRLAYGWRQDPAAEVERVEAPRDTFLAGRLVTVPGDAEAVLHQVYGPGWATPDQGFEVADQLRRDEAFLLTPEELRTLAAHAPDRTRILGSPPGVRR
jgi:hypothetical protein